MRLILGCYLFIITRRLIASSVEIPLMRLSRISVIGPGHHQCIIMYIVGLKAELAAVGPTSGVEAEERLLIWSLTSPFYMIKNSTI